MRSTTLFGRRIAGALAAAAVLGTVLPIGAVNAATTAVAFEYRVPAVTATSLSVSPSSPVEQGVPVRLTATVTPATAAGTVQFKDGSAGLGNPVTVSHDGIASGTTSKLAAGAHQLTAVFTPADASAFSSSTSPPVAFVVTGASGTAPDAPQSPNSPLIPNLPKIPLIPLPSSPGSR